ncbi:pirin family protein [Chiayiivirga flava]|uniref:pirin family protein n=1 Tax=Chiayiivirga flava TaxID=659595 RepID=UPI003CCE0446
MNVRIRGRVHDLGGFTVRRVLPSAERRQVGPFVFLDHIGPARFAPGEGLDVRPHPHIGLATVTYLFEGALMHRDSVGSEQVIRPGDVNWMTAGRGIVHSERTPSPEREDGHAMHGLQFWVGLPQRDEEVEPSFVHHPAAALPEWDEGGVRLRLIAGRAFGRQAPTRVLSPLFFLDARLPAGASLALPADYSERAMVVLSGDVRIGEETVEPGETVVFEAAAPIVLDSAGGARVGLFGGEPLDGPRRMWWNFVSSSPERIERAKDDWRAQRLGQVPGESEFIPLPEQ